MHVLQPKHTKLNEKEIELMKKIKRIGFITFVIAIGVTLSLTAVDNPALAQSKTFEWKIQSTWPAADFHQVNPTGLKEKIEAMSGGRLELELMPAGAVVPPFELLGAVSKEFWMPAMPGRVTGRANIPPRPFLAVWPEAPLA